ncbi:MAG: fructose bisphosphate aldolase [Pseudomonadota bacterium]
MDQARYQAQLDSIRNTSGFVAALDQSGGSTPKALQLYGVEEDAYGSESEMFDLIHGMRARIIECDSFNRDNICAAILFQMTMERDIQGMPTSEFLWQKKQIVPLLKVDRGLEDEADGVQLMKPIPGLAPRLEQAAALSVFGTKMRSVVKHASETGVASIVKQQFEIGKEILGCGLVPIIEPEVDINSPTKARAEAQLKAAIAAELDALDSDMPVMLKLTLPEAPDFYAELIAHPKVAKVVALSGGYSRAEANERLAQNHGMIASFSRALTEGLMHQQSDAEFAAALTDNLESIAAASRT